MTKYNTKRVKERARVKAKRHADSAYGESGQLVVSTVRPHLGAPDSYSFLRKAFEDTKEESKCSADGMSCDEHLFPFLKPGQRLLPIPEHKAVSNPPLEINPEIDAICDAMVAEINGVSRFTL